MSRRKVNYIEGDWIALPLVRRGGWGLGLIARCKAPSLLGYFFGPRFAQPPTMADVAGLRREHALLVANLGDLGLLNGEWLVVGHHPNWNRADWPIPLFVTKDGPRLELCTIDENHPGKIVYFEPITAEDADRRGAIMRTVVSGLAEASHLRSLNESIRNF